MRFLGKHTLNYVITTKKGQTTLFLSPSHQGIIRAQVDRTDAKQPENHAFSRTQTQVNRENTKPPPPPPPPPPTPPPPQNYSPLTRRKECTTTVNIRFPIWKK